MTRPNDRLDRLLLLNTSVLHELMGTLAQQLCGEVKFELQAKVVGLLQP